MKYKVQAIIVLVLLLSLPFAVSAEENVEEKNPFDIPNHVLDISKENTYPNSTEDQEVIEPSELAKELIEETNIPIENPEFIKMLNETTLHPSPIAIGYRGMVYLGRWPLNYESQETTINWEYQKINENQINNIGGENTQYLKYVQQNEKEINGALKNKISNAEQIKQMILLTSKNKTKLPLAYNTVIGQNTKKENTYDVPVDKTGTLSAYAPAVSEKGQVTFGEVYIQLKGSKKSIQIKNVTKQGVGAWIPIEDHVSFSFELK